MAREILGLWENAERDWYRTSCPDAASHRQSSRDRPDCRRGVVTKGKACWCSLEVLMQFFTPWLLHVTQGKLMLWVKKSWWEHYKIRTKQIQRHLYMNLWILDAKNWCYEWHYAYIYGFLSQFVCVLPSQYGVREITDVVPRFINGWSTMLYMDF